MNKFGSNVSWVLYVPDWGINGKLPDVTYYEGPHTLDHHDKRLNRENRVQVIDDYFIDVLFRSLVYLYIPYVLPTRLSIRLIYFQSSLLFTFLEVPFFRSSFLYLVKMLLNDFLKKFLIPLHKIDYFPFVTDRDLCNRKY